MAEGFRQHKKVIEHFFLNEILEELEKKKDFGQKDLANIEDRISEFMEKVEKGEYKCDIYNGLIPFGEKISEKLGVEGPNGLLVYNPKFKYLNRRKVLTIIYLEILNKEIENIYKLDDEFRNFLQNSGYDKDKWKEYEKRYISWRNKLILMKDLAEKLGEKNDSENLESLRSNIEKRIERIEQIHKQKISESIIEDLIGVLEEEETQLSSFDSEVSYSGTGYRWAREARRPGKPITHK